jgi:hypothetical protein
MLKKEWRYPRKEIFELVYKHDLDQETAEALYEEAQEENFWDEYSRWVKRNKKPKTHIYDYLSFSVFTKVLRFFNRK